MSGSPNSNARFHLRFSATTAIPWLLGVFYLACMICVPIFADKAGEPVPVDKAVAVLLFPWALLGTLRAFRARQRYLIFVAGYFCLAVISSLMHLLDRNYGCYPVAAPALGIVLDAKPFTYIFAFYELLSRRHCARRRAISTVMRVVLAVALVNGIFSVRDIALGGHSIWGIELGTGPFGLPLACGLFNHKYSSACITMLGALSALALIKGRPSLSRLIAFTSLFALLIFNGSVKETVGLAVAGAMFLLLPSGKRSSGALQTKVCVFLFMAAIGFSASSYISQMVSRRYREYGVEASIRVALHTAAYTLATEDFPFGSGAGTFASKPSRDIAYSPLYYRFGIFAMYRGGPSDGSFLMDAWWPHILAETGFIGCGFYIAIVGYGLIRLTRQQKLRRDAESFFLLSAAAALVINSIAAPTFTVDILQPIVGLAWGAAMLKPEEQRAEQMDAVAGSDVSESQGLIISTA